MAGTLAHSFVTSFSGAEVPPDPVSALLFCVHSRGRPLKAQGQVGRAGAGALWRRGAPRMHTGRYRVWPTQAMLGLGPLCHTGKLAAKWLRPSTGVNQAPPCVWVLHPSPTPLLRCWLQLLVRAPGWTWPPAWRCGWSVCVPTWGSGRRSHTQGSGQPLWPMPWPFPGPSRACWTPTVCGGEAQASPRVGSAEQLLTLTPVSLPAGAVSPTSWL